MSNANAEEIDLQMSFVIRHSVIRHLLRPVRLTAGCETLVLAMRVQFPHGSLTTAKWWNWDTRDAQNVVRKAMRVRISPWLLTRVSQRSAGPHKPGPSGATPEPAMTRYANWQSDEVESLVFVGSTPTLVTYGPACSVGATDPCKIGVMGSTPIGST